MYNRLKNLFAGTFATLFSSVLLADDHSPRVQSVTTFPMSVSLEEAEPTTALTIDKEGTDKEGTECLPGGVDEPGIYRFFRILPAGNSEQLNVIDMEIQVNYDPTGKVLEPIYIGAYESTARPVDRFAPDAADLAIDFPGVNAYLEGVQKINGFQVTLPEDVKYVLEKRQQVLSLFIGNFSCKSGQISWSDSDGELAASEGFLVLSGDGKDALMIQGRYEQFYFSSQVFSWIEQKVSQATYGYVNTSSVTSMIYMPLFGGIVDLEAPAKVENVQLID